MYLKNLCYNGGMKKVYAKILTMLTVMSLAPAGAVMAADPAELPVEFELGESISISLSSSKLRIEDLLPGSQKNSNNVIVTVATNSEGGYQLRATVGDTEHPSDELTNALLPAGSTNKFSMVSGNNQTLGAGMWGYSTAGASATTFSNLPLYDSGEAKLISESSAAGSTPVNFLIGANAVAGMPAGGYTNVINFVAVTKAAPVSLCGTTPTMQSIASIKNSLSEEVQTQLCDERDGKTYYVAKLKDGNVWMTQNLDFELDTSVALTNELSDIGYGDKDGNNKSGRTSWMPENSTQSYQYKDANGTTHSDGNWNNDYNTKAHSYRPASDPTAGTSGDYGNDGDTYFAPAFMQNGTTMASWKTMADCTGAGNSAETCAHWSVGTFYSWRAATAGSGDVSVTTRIDVTDSICPKGWKLPVGNGGDFQGLVNNGMTTSNISSAPYYFLRAGYYFGYYGAVYSTGDFGNYWSSTSYSSSSRAYLLYFSSGAIDPAYNLSRYSGMSVRCVAR